MEYVKLGNSDLKISKITLGTWAIGGGNWDNYNSQSAIKTIETALDNGINCIDTAPAYGGGNAEELIGNAIKNKRDKIILATKCGLDISKRYIKDLSPEFIEKDLNHSLQRLQTDYIDLYQCHWPDEKTPLEDTMNKLVKLQKDGKIRYIGVSNFSDHEIIESLKFAEITSAQPQYSLLERTIENDIQKTCVKNNIAIIPYGSLGGGMLTGKYKERPVFSRLDARSFFYDFFKEKYWPKVKVLIDSMTKIAEEKGTKPANLAISWLLTRQGVASTLVGARNPEQALENINSIELTLTEEEVEMLNILSDNVYNHNSIN